MVWFEKFFQWPNLVIHLVLMVVSQPSANESQSYIAGVPKCFATMSPVSVILTYILSWNSKHQISRNEQWKQYNGTFGKMDQL